jgi:dCTP deaminase
MSLLPRSEIKRRLNSRQPDQIFIDPILSEEQLGAVSFDLRLGCDFLVSIQTRRPSISLLKDNDFRDPSMFFQESRRDIGESFVLYSSQTVLATSLEYVGLPADLYANVVSRSSYNRLGITLHSMFQPGYRGCISLELFNHSNSPIELVVGSRVVQAQFHKLTEDEQYIQGQEARKYVGHVRPTTSRAADDADLVVLSKVFRQKT